MRVLPAPQTLQLHRAGEQTRPGCHWYVACLPGLDAPEGTASSCRRRRVHLAPPGQCRPWPASLARVAPAGTGLVPETRQGEAPPVVGLVQEQPDLEGLSVEEQGPRPVGGRALNA